MRTFLMGVLSIVVVSVSPRLQEPPAVALRNVRVIDGTGSAPSSNQTVVIQGPRIVAVGASDVSRARHRQHRTLLVLVPQRSAGDRAVGLARRARRNAVSEVGKGGSDDNRDTGGLGSATQRS